MGYWKLILAGAIIVLSNNVFGGGFDDKESSYAIAQDGCGLTDGYVCLDMPEDDFLSAASQERMISGNHLKAWQAALDAFNKLAELDAEQKNLKHYKVGFAENSEHYVVLFQALLLPALDDNQVVGVMTNTLGKTTRFWINKQSMTVDRHLFYK